MLTDVEKELVELVYKRLLDSESAKEWTDYDENLMFFEMLTDEEMVLEAQAKNIKNSSGDFRCKINHKIELCMAPMILEASKLITDLYDANGRLFFQDRYTLTCYLALSEMGLIYSEKLLG